MQSIEDPTEQQFKLVWGLSYEESYKSVLDIFQTFGGDLVWFNERFHKMVETILYGRNDFILDAQDIKECSEVMRAVSKLLSLAYDRRNRGISFGYKIDGLTDGTPHFIIDEVLDEIISHAGEESTRLEFATMFAFFICPQACRPLTATDHGDILFTWRILIELLNKLEKATPGIKDYFENKAQTELVNTAIDTLNGGVRV